MTVDYKTLFRQSSELYLLFLPDAPRFTILECSDALAARAGTTRENLVTKSVPEVFPEKWGKYQPALCASVARAIESKKPDTMAVLRYDLPNENTAEQESYWSPRHTPIFSDNGQVQYILQQVVDVTYFIRGNGREKMTQGQLQALERIRLEIIQRGMDLNKANDELSTTNGQLRVACQAAEAANRAKADFVANISHEIRTPLNAIIGFAQILQQDPTVAPVHREQIETMCRASEHLLALVNDVLDMSRIDSGKMTLNCKPASLSDLLREAALTLSRQCHEKGIQLRLELAPDLPRTVVVDTLRLRQLLLNLLGNAVKFTTKGYVLLEAHSQRIEEDQCAAKVTISVSDTGPGISEEQLPRLFQRFEQGAERLPTLGGAGLGLAISRQLVCLMGGDIDVKSKLGEGTTFTLNLVMPVIENSSSSDLSSPRHPSSYGRAAETIGKVCATQRQRPVLVVDDLETNRQVLRAMLVQMGFERIFTVDDGDAAMKLIDAELPAVVFMDIYMPRPHGIEAARRIRAIPSAAKLPIIAMSASVLDRNAIQADLAVFDDFLSKPIRMVELRRALVMKAGFQFYNIEDNQASLKQRHVLVVDDQELNRQLVSTILQRAGHTVAVCSNGCDAVQCATHQDFDIILMDLQMPGMHGLDAIKSIRDAMKTAPKRPIIIAMSADEQTKESKNSELDGYITKPFRANELLSVVNACA